MRLRPQGCAREAAPARLQELFLSTNSKCSSFCRPGSRFDWVVSCSVAGKYQISDVSAPVTNLKIFMGVIAYIEVSGTAVQSADVPTSLASVTKPYYLQDQTEAEVDSEHSINFSQVCLDPTDIGPSCSGWS